MKLCARVVKQDSTKLREKTNKQNSSMANRPDDTTAYLLVRDVGSNHHVKDRQQFVTGDFVVIVQIIHLEGNCRNDATNRN